jgi:hypothetical protein
LNEEISTNAIENNLYIAVYGAKTDKDFQFCIDNNVKVIGNDFPENIIKKNINLREKQNVFTFFFQINNFLQK